MTRGRHANHAHVAGTTADPEHPDHRTLMAPVVTLDDAVSTMQAAAVRVGAEQSAHTLLDHTADARSRGVVGPKPPPVLSPAELRRRAEQMVTAAPQPPQHASPQPQSSRSLSR